MLLPIKRQVIVVEAAGGHSGRHGQVARALRQRMETWGSQTALTGLLGTDVVKMGLISGVRWPSTPQTSLNPWEIAWHQEAGLGWCEGKRRPLESPGMSTKHRGT